MSFRLPSIKTLAISLAGLLVAYTLFGCLMLPRIIQSQSIRYISEKTGHRLSLDRPEFNPFTLSLRISNLHLQEPDGKQLLAFRNLTVELSPASLFKRALVFNAIELDDPEATLVLKPGNRLNWSQLVDSLDEKDAKAAGTQRSQLPRISIRSFGLKGGHIDFADERTGFTAHIAPLDLNLRDISTLPNDRGRYRISARTSFDTLVTWQGQATLNPLSADGSLNVENLDLSPLQPYFKDILPNAAPAGAVSVSTDYHLSYADNRLDLSLKNLEGRLSNFRIGIGGPHISIKAIEAKNGQYDLAQNRIVLGTLSLSGSQVALPSSGGAASEVLQLGNLTLTNTRGDLAGKRIALDHVDLSNGLLHLARNAHGRIDLVDALHAAMPLPGKSPEEKAQRWRFRINRIDLANSSVSFHDDSVKPAADLALNDIAMSVDGLSDNLAAPLPVQLSFHARDGGSFKASGQVVPADPSAKLHFMLENLALKPAQPYLAELAKLKLASGQLDAEGRAAYGRQGASYAGSFSLRNVRLLEADTNAVFLRWKSVGSRNLKATSARLNIGRLDIDHLGAKLIIAKDKTVNLSRILNKPKARAPAAAAGKSKPFQVSIDRIRIRLGEMDYADYSLVLPFATRIHKLHGYINGLSTRPGSSGQLELSGQVDKFGSAHAAGLIDLFDPTDLTDIRVMFRNVNMPRLTPYSSTFAGRKIDAGKLSLNLEYKIRHRQLEGDNQIIIDNIKLGERVESPQAKDLPLDLAIAILEDPEGRIDLGLPVSGNLDDPQFSYGSIIWKAIVNIFEKIATAPFRALGALFGGGAEQIDSIRFDPGAAALSPPEQEKIIRIAGMLNKRPGLALTVHGVYSDADRVALQDLQLRREVAVKAGEHLGAHENPGPLSTTSPKIQDALESLYSDRIGSAELAALKAGFRKANPGQLRQGVSEKMISGLSGLFRKKRTLNEQDVAQLKGADFYIVLFRRLREREPIAEDALQSLGKARGENAYAALQAAGAPAGRLQLAPPEKVESDAQGVPAKLDLGAAPKPAAAR